MRLSDDKQYEVAVFLAARFPGWEDRAHLARSTGLGDAQIAGDPLGSWRLIVKQALERDRLPRLLENCANADRTDERLRSLADQAAKGELAAVPGRDWTLLIGAVGAVVLGLTFLIVLLVWVFGGPSEPEEVVVAAPLTAPVTLGTPTEPTAVADPTAAPVPVPVPETTAGKPAPTPEALAVSGAPTATPAEAPPPEVVVVPVAAPPAPSNERITSGPCKGATPQEGVIGYAYAGADAPKVTSGEWRPQRQLNVRRDYPDEHNGFNAKAPIVCVVPDTGTVVLAKDPIAVTGGAFWVPVAAVR